MTTTEMQANGAENEHPGHRWPVEFELTVSAVDRSAAVKELRYIHAHAAYRLLSGLPEFGDFRRQNSSHSSFRFKVNEESTNGDETAETHDEIHELTIAADCLDDAGFYSAADRLRHLAVLLPKDPDQAVYHWLTSKVTGESNV